MKTGSQLTLCPDFPVSQNRGKVIGRLEGKKNRPLPTPASFIHGQETMLKWQHVLLGE